MLVASVIALGRGADLQNQIETYNREVDLGLSLLGPTIGPFERAVAKLTDGKDGTIKIEHMTWAFYHPKNEAPFPSSVEMVSGFNIVVKGGVVTCEDATNKVPVAYVRLVDPAATNIVCDVEVLGSMAGPGGTNRTRVSGIWFRYVYDGSWREDESARRVFERK